MEHPLIAGAYRLATRAHEGQVDKSGEPYIAHPIAVAEKVKHLGPDHQIVAVLHDTVEDTDVTLEDIEALFGSTVAQAVDAISRRDGETYMAFIARAAANDIARVVKRADIEHNTSPERSAGLTVSLSARYAAAIIFLDGADREIQMRDTQTDVLGGPGVRMGPDIDLDAGTTEDRERVRAHLKETYG